MSTLNEAMSRVRSLLLNPRLQAPTTDQLWTALLYNFQNFINELDSTGLPWTYNEQSINVNASQTDYLLTEPTGKVLFVIAYPENTGFGPVSLEFADLADVSSDFFLFSPLDFGFSPDFNETANFPFPYECAFYRKDGDLWLRLPPYAYALASVKVVYSTGDWLANLNTEDSAVLSQHHSVPEVRTALDLLPGAEWTSTDADQLKRANLERSLSRQEERYAQQFLYGRRMMTSDQSSVRYSFGDV